MKDKDNLKANARKLTSLFGSIRIVYMFLAVVVLLVAFVFPVFSFADIVTFTSSGSFTVPSGVSSLTVDVVGGGGAGAGGTNEGAGTGGGGGGRSVATLGVTGGQILEVIVGAGGVHGDAPHCESGAFSNGEAGGASSVGSVVAYGGGAGETGGAPGAGGWGSTNSGTSGTYPPKDGPYPIRWSISGGDGGTSGSGGAGGSGSSCLQLDFESSVDCYKVKKPEPGGYYGGGGGGSGHPTTCDTYPRGPVYGGNGAPGVVSISFAGNSGTINVSSNISSSWIITGPATIFGSGISQSSPSQPAGTYTITWGKVSGYTTPKSQSFTLIPGGEILFNGSYTTCSLSLGQVCYSGSSCRSDAYKGTVQCDGSCSATALPSNFGKVCLVSNVCGQSNEGTIGCDGSCSVTTAPALPSQYGTPCQSAANSCGQKANGILGCSGTCTAVTPADLNCTTCPSPNGNGVCDPKENNSNCPADCPYVAPATTSTPAGEGAIWTGASEWTLTASPNPIFSNTKTMVSYSVTGATGCTLVGVGEFSGKETDRYTGGPAADYPTTKLQENTIFTLTCSNAYSGRKDSKSVRVIVRTINIREF